MSVVLHGKLEARPFFYSKRERERGCMYEGMNVSTCRAKDSSKATCGSSLETCQVANKFLKDQGRWGQILTY